MRRPPRRIGADASAVWGKSRFESTKFGDPLGEGKVSEAVEFAGVFGQVSNHPIRTIELGGASHQQLRRLVAQLVRDDLACGIETVGAMGCTPVLDQIVNSLAMRRKSGLLFRRQILGVVWIAHLKFLRWKKSSVFHKFHFAA